MFTITAYKTSYRRKPLPPEDWTTEHRMECSTAMSAREQVRAFFRMGYPEEAVVVVRRRGSEVYEVDVFDPYWEGK